MTILIPRSDIFFCVFRKACISVCRKMASVCCRVFLFPSAFFVSQQGLEIEDGNSLFAGIFLDPLVGFQYAPIDVILITFHSPEPPYPRSESLLDAAPAPDGHFRGDNGFDPVRSCKIDHRGDTSARSFERRLNPLTAGSENVVDEPPDNNNIRTFINHIPLESRQHFERLLAVHSFVNDHEFSRRPVCPPSRVGCPDADYT